jgi:ABC-2 type transport system permease protein
VSALLVGIVLGGAMSAGVGMMAGSAGRDFIGTLFYGILFLVPMIIPAFAALFPGTASQWVKVFPSYGIVQTIVLATAYAEPWSVLVPYLLLAAGWCAVVFGGGLLLLRRKVVTL